MVSAEHREIIDEMGLTVNSPKKESGTAGILSFLLTGAGNMYNGKVGKGIGLAILVIISCITIIGIIIAIPIWIWNIFNAISEAKRINAAIDALRECEEAFEENSDGEALAKIAEETASSYEFDLFRKEIKRVASLRSDGGLNDAEAMIRIIDISSRLSTKKLTADKDDYLSVAIEMKKMSLINEDEFVKIKISLL